METEEKEIEEFIEKYGIDHGEDGIEISDEDWVILQDLVSIED